MSIKRTTVKSTPFSDFVRYASSREKRKFFDKVVREAIKEQKVVLALAEQAKRLKRE